MAPWVVNEAVELPRLRLGYLIAPDAELADRIRRRQPEWAVNGLALAVLPELLDRTDLAAWNGELGRLRAHFVSELVDLGYSARETSANWSIVDDFELRARLAVRGVVVRDCASFGLLGVHRVAVPTWSDLDRVVAAFADVAQP